MPGLPSSVGVKSGCPIIAEEVPINVNVIHSIIIRRPFVSLVIPVDQFSIISIDEASSTAQLNDLLFKKILTGTILYLLAVQLSHPARWLQ